MGASNNMHNNMHNSTQMQTTGLSRQTSLPTPPTSIVNSKMIPFPLLSQSSPNFFNNLASNQINGVNCNNNITNANNNMSGGNTPSISNVCNNSSNSNNNNCNAIRYPSPLPQDIFFSHAHELNNRPASLLTQSLSSNNNANIQNAHSLHNSSTVNNSHCTSNVHMRSDSTSLLFQQQSAAVSAQNFQQQQFIQSQNALRPTLNPNPSLNNHVNATSGTSSLQRHSSLPPFTQQPKHYHNQFKQF
eukprot:GDKK01049074.1.p1 GENE.GDKK01049074.1~~GDKK01049074.1.p1  ORF type:complete len:245 (-),score=69.77 GDKK01049074.1:168-902(-)